MNQRQKPSDDLVKLVPKMPKKTAKNEHGRYSQERWTVIYPQLTSKLIFLAYFFVAFLGELIII